MGPLGSIGGDLRGCCVDGVHTLFMLCHSLQVIDYERVCPMFIHYFRLGSYCEELVWMRLFYLEITCTYLACRVCAVMNMQCAAVVCCKNVCTNVRTCWLPRLSLHCPAHCPLTLFMYMNTAWYTAYGVS